MGKKNQRIHLDRKPYWVVLDRDLPEDKTCVRCCLEFLCTRCRVEVSTGEMVCLACVEDEEEYMLSDWDARRLRALKSWWHYLDTQELEPR